MFTKPTAIKLKYLFYLYIFAYIVLLIILPSICLYASNMEDALRPRVNVPPVFSTSLRLKTTLTYRNILCQCLFGNSNDNVPHIVVVFIWYLLFSGDISCVTSVSCMPQVYVTLRNFRQGEGESWNSYSWHKTTFESYVSEIREKV